MSFTLTSDFRATPNCENAASMIMLVVVQDEIARALMHDHQPTVLQVQSLHSGRSSTHGAMCKATYSFVGRMVKHTTISCAVIYGYEYV